MNLLTDKFFVRTNSNFELNLERLLTLKNVEPEAVVYIIKELVPEFSHFRLKILNENEEKHV